MISAIARRLASLWRQTSSHCRIAHARLTGSSISDNCQISERCQISLGNDSARRGSIAIGERCELASDVLLHPFGGSISLGPHVYLGPHSVVYGHGGVVIEEDCVIAMQCRILSSNHAIPPLGTTIRSQPDVLLPTRIGRDVWLGAGVTVLGGVTIGEGCVVGAGAVVTHDLPPGSVCAGIPARIIRQREASS